jgi:hypothetical protein
MTFRLRALLCKSFHTEYFTLTLTKWRGGVPHGVRDGAWKVNTLIDFGENIIQQNCAHNVSPKSSTMQVVSE